MGLGGVEENHATADLLAAAVAGAPAGGGVAMIADFAALPALASSAIPS
jgi:hypothetical protein